MSTKLGPWTGINNKDQPDELTEKQVADAVDGVFSGGGFWEPRASEVLSLPANAHSMWQAPDGRLFGVVDGVLSLLNTDGTVQLGVAPVVGEVCYAAIPDYLMVSDEQAVYRITEHNTVSYLLPKSLPPILASAPGGFLCAGTYTVAVALTYNGEEGPISATAEVTIPDNGAITCMLQGSPHADGYVLYRSSPDGDVLYRASSGPLAAWGVTAKLRADHLGAAEASPGTDKLPAVRCLCLWGGRVLGAVGRALIFSEPLRYGVWNPSNNYVQMPERITAVYPVDGGVFIGTAAGLTFLAGRNPVEWTINKVSAYGTSINALAVPAGNFDPELVGTTTPEVGVFFTESGVALALPDGSVIQPQATQLKLPVYSGGSSFVLNEHIVTIVKE